MMIYADYMRVLTWYQS